MERVNVRNGHNGVNLPIEEVKARLGIDIELNTSLITGVQFYMFSDIKVNKTKNRFTKKNIKNKLERLEDYNLELLIDNNEVSNLDELINLIYKTGYKPSRKSNYDVWGVRLANHSNTATYGDNNAMIIANLVFDNK